MHEIITDRQDELRHWMAEKNAHRYIEDYGTYIGLARDNHIIACTGYDAYLGYSIQGHIGIDGRITKEWLWFIFYYPFIQLGVNKIISPIFSSNIKALRLCSHMGFIEEARIKQSAPCGGDIILMTIVKDNCRFI